MKDFEKTEPVKVEIEIIKTPKGNYRIKFPAGDSVLVKDIPDNLPLIVSLEVEYLIQTSR